MFERWVPLGLRLRVAVLLLALGLILALVNSQIFFKQRIVEEGEVMLLRLAPRDPRSLFQGDYMSLRYAITRSVTKAARESEVFDGRAVVALDAQGEATFVDIYNGQALRDEQRLLQFRRRGDSVRLASDAFFFEEGQAERFATARFGELRVNAQGEAVLVGLRDENARPLGESLH